MPDVWTRLVTSIVKRLPLAKRAFAFLLVTRPRTLLGQSQTRPYTFPEKQNIFTSTPGRRILISRTPSSLHIFSSRRLWAWNAKTPFAFVRRLSQAAKQIRLRAASFQSQRFPRPSLLMWRRTPSVFALPLVFSLVRITPAPYGAF